MHLIWNNPLIQTIKNFQYLKNEKINYGCDFGVLNRIKIFHWSNVQTSKKNCTKEILLKDKFEVEYNQKQQCFQLPRSITFRFPSYF